jgi:hypothetical protein
MPRHSRRSLWRNTRPGMPVEMAEAIEEIRALRQEERTAPPVKLFLQDPGNPLEREAWTASLRNYEQELLECDELAAVGASPAETRDAWIPSMWIYEQGVLERDGLAAVEALSADTVAPEGYPVISCQNSRPSSWRRRHFEERRRLQEEGSEASASHRDSQFEVDLQDAIRASLADAYAPSPPAIPAPHLGGAAGGAAAAFARQAVSAAPSAVDDELLEGGQELFEMVVDACIVAGTVDTTEDDPADASPAVETEVAATFAAGGTEAFADNCQVGDSLQVFDLAAADSDVEVDENAEWARETSTMLDEWEMIEWAQ